jgi:hypothetical protein
VGEKVATNEGGSSLTPPRTRSPGTETVALEGPPPIPAPGRTTVPAEKPASREAGGAGTTVVWAGFSPTIAREAWFDKVGGNGRAPISGAAGSPALTLGARPPGGAVKARGCGRGRGVSIGKPFTSMANWTAGASGSSSAAGRGIRTSGGGVKGSGCGRGPPEDNGRTLETAFDAARGASGSAGAALTSGLGCVGGATKGRTSLGAGATATTFGRCAGLTCSTDGSGVQIICGGR